MNHLDVAFEDHSKAVEFVRAFKRRSIPGKFTYVGPAALSHLAYDAQSANHEATRNIDLEILGITNLPQESLSDVTIVDVGPGDGAHTLSLIRRLQNNSLATISTYLAVDYGNSLGHFAVSRISLALPDVDCRFVQADIEVGVFPGVDESLKSSSAILFLFLGNTIGNVDDPISTLINIGRAMPQDSHIALEYALFNPSKSADSYQEPYASAHYDFNIAHPLFMAGLPTSSVKMTHAFDWTRRSIISTASIVQEVHVELFNEPFDLKIGDKFECFVSRRFVSSQIVDLVKSAGFRVSFSSEDVNAGVGLILASYDSGSTK